MNVKRRSQKQEKSVAKLFNARTTIASGAIWFNKADVRNDKVLIECKTTEKSYYAISSKVWEKIEEEAIKDSMRIPLLMIDLEDSDRYVVFSPKYFDSDIYAQNRSIDTKDRKTFQISISDFNLMRDIGVYALFFTICGKKKNELVCMPIKEFLSSFESEIGDRNGK